MLLSKNKSHFPVSPLNPIKSSCFIKTPPKILNFSSKKSNMPLSKEHSSLGKTEKSPENGGVYKKLLKKLFFPIIKNKFKVYAPIFSHESTQKKENQIKIAVPRISFEFNNNKKY